MLKRVYAGERSYKWEAICFDGWRRWRVLQKLTTEKNATTLNLKLLV